MADFSTTLSIAASGMQAQANRVRYTSENIANADTPGYHRKLVSFRAAVATEGGVETSRVRLDQSPLADVHDPAHPLANDQGNYQGSNVDLLIEIADAREANRSYEANLKVFDQVRQMSSSLLDLLRR
ncbi:flagellar basal-body rod protein FlgC [Ketogulonicigenium robustum]|uniref:Flagellar basal body rod protein FlgB n=1 Tax=Ketogulonicigenium robustum TaxID=92947 RepID=A0A1W6P1L3_9RHOB|nr:flagellar basal body rod protein FlgC [Ketogulonicigenium robustum]ARO15405.1 flagellar basal-body rod protein FlgC [Ketogulonicigenium robustum]